MTGKDENVPVVKKNVSIMDLPNELIVKLFEYLDIPNRLRLRVNKRLDKLQLSVPNKIKEIRIDDRFPGRNHLASYEKYKSVLKCVSAIWSNDSNPFPDSSPLDEKYESGLSVVWSNGSFKRPKIDFDLSNLHRLALNSAVQNIHIFVDAKENGKRFIDFVLPFVADRLCVEVDNVEQWNVKAMEFPQLSRAHLNTLAQNARCASINGECTSLVVEDFSKLRKRMIEGDCKLEVFNAQFMDLFMNALLKAFFGVDFFEEGFSYDSPRIFRAKDESVELYSRNPRAHNLNVTHYGKNLITTLNLALGTLFISFKRSPIEDITREKQNRSAEKIKFNHLYVCTCN